MDRVAQAIRAKFLLDGTGAEPVEDPTVLIEGEIIREVGPSSRVRIPSAARVTDLGDAWLLPGVVDAHSHCVLRADPRTAAEQHQAADTELVLRAVANLRADLRSGVTTIRTMSDRDFLDLSVQRAAEEGLIAAPHLIVATRGIRPSNGFGSSAVVADGIDEVRKRVRENLRAGADLIKLFVGGWQSGDAKAFQLGASSRLSTYSREEISTAVEEAARVGRKVAAHVHGGQGLTDCLETGVFTIEHGSLLENHHVDLFLQHGAWWVPTLTVLFHEVGLASKETFQRFREKVEAAQTNIREMLPYAWRRGVNIAVGTDARHGYMAQELAYLVEFGIPPRDALLAGTLHAARASGCEDRAGSVEPDKRADLIGVAQNPLQDIKSLLDVRFIMKAGQAYSLSPL